MIKGYKLNKWTSWGSTRLSAGSCIWVGATPVAIQAGGWSDWEHPWGEGLGSAGGQKAGHKPAMCLHSPESQPYPGLRQKQRGQQAKGGDSAPLLWWDPTGSPASSSETLSTGQTWTCWSGARGGHKNGPRPGTPLLSGKAERVGAVQTAEEKVPGRPDCNLSVVKGAYNKDGDKPFSRACCDRTRCNGFKLWEGRFKLDIKKEFFTMRVWKANMFPRDVVDAPSL